MALLKALCWALIFIIRIRFTISCRDVTSVDCEITQKQLSSDGIKPMFLREDLHIAQ